LAISQLIVTLPQQEIDANEELHQVTSYTYLVNKTLQSCLDKLPAYAKKSVHSNLITVSSLRFIQAICGSHLPISTPNQQTYLSIIESSLQKNIDTVQQASAEALGSLSIRFDISNNLQKWFGNLQPKSTFIVRRGWAVALGYLRLHEYYTVLSKLWHTIENDGDVEVKRNAIGSIGMIFPRMNTFEGMSNFGSFID